MSSQSSDVSTKQKATRISHHYSVAEEDQVAMELYEVKVAHSNSPMHTIDIARSKHPTFTDSYKLLNYSHQCQLALTECKLLPPLSTTGFSPQKYQLREI